MNNRNSRLVMGVSRSTLALIVLCVMTACTDDDRTTNGLLGPEMAASVTGTSGQRLFDHETFGGNGRRCRTCHSGSDGTISVEEVQERLRDPSDPLFVHDGLDDFASGTTRIAAHATILIRRPLPRGVVPLDDPSATSVVLARGVPSTVNTPAFDPALMYDIREQTLQEQALGAIHGHTQNAIEPTAEQLDAIALFQRTDNRFFSSMELQRFAAGGPEPGLPEGHSPRNNGDGSSSSTHHGIHPARKASAPCVIAARC